MTQKEFYTMKFYKGMQFKYSSALIKPDLILTIAGVDFQNGIIIMQDGFKARYEQVTVIEEAR